MNFQLGWIFKPYCRAQRLTFTFHPSLRVMAAAWTKNAFPTSAPAATAAAAAPARRGGAGLSPTPAAEPDGAEEAAREVPERSRRRWFCRRFLLHRGEIVEHSDLVQQEAAKRNGPGSCYKNCTALSRSGNWTRAISKILFVILFCWLLTESR